MKRPLTLLSAILFMFFISCKKEKEPEPSNVPFTKKKIGNFGISGVTPYPLNWENIDYMPTPPGMPAVLVPWASGASRQFAPEMANDYSSSSGLRINIV